MDGDSQDGTWPKWTANGAFEPQLSCLLVGTERNQLTTTMLEYCFCEIM